MTMATYHLYRWSVVGDSPYTAPELRRIRLSGFRDQDAKAVITSHVVNVKGREVETSSGSTYILEDVSPDYLQFLEDTGEKYDPENPIRIKGK